MGGPALVNGVASIVLVMESQMSRFFLALATMMALHQSAFSEIVYDNLYTGTGGSQGFTSSPTIQRLAQSFTLSRNITGFESIKINLFRSGAVGSSVFNVNIFDNVSNKPNQAIVSQIGGTNYNLSSVSTNASSYWQANNVSANLSAGTYWLVVIVGSPDNNFQWATKSTNSGPSTPYSSYMYSGEGAPSGGTWTSTGNYLGAQISVPEPGTWMLGMMAVGLGGTGLWWRRRRERSLSSIPSLPNRAGWEAAPPG